MNALKTSALVAAALFVAAPAAQAGDQTATSMYDQLRDWHTATYRQTGAPPARGVQGPMRAAMDKAKPVDPTLQEQVWNLHQGK